MSAGDAAVRETFEETGIKAGKFSTKHVLTNEIIYILATDDINDNEDNNEDDNDDGG